MHGRLIDDVRAVQTRDWISHAFRECGSGHVRFSLLQADLDSLRLALEEFSQAQANVNRAAGSGIPRRDWERDWQRMFHNAKVFIVAMRRFARLLEATTSRRNEYPPHIARAIDLAWKSHRAFFNEYSDARNA